jgi:hypothetical protein
VIDGEIEASGVTEEMLVCLPSIVWVKRRFPE